LVKIEQKGGYNELFQGYYAATELFLQ